MDGSFATENNRHIHFYNKKKRCTIDGYIMQRHFEKNTSSVWNPPLIQAINDSPLPAGDTLKDVYNIDEVVRNVFDTDTLLSTIITAMAERVKHSQTESMDKHDNSFLRRKEASFSPHYLHECCA